MGPVIDYWLGLEVLVPLFVANESVFAWEVVLWGSPLVLLA